MPDANVRNLSPLYAGGMIVIVIFALLFAFGAGRLDPPPNATASPSPVVTQAPASPTEPVPPSDGSPAPSNGSATPSDDSVSPGDD